VRYWEDVAVGDEIPGFDVFLSETKVVEQVSGSQDFYPVHHDREFARAGGHRDIFFNTGFTRGALGRLLGDYAAAAGTVRRLQYAMRKMSYPGDTVRARGRVTRTHVDGDGRALVELDVALHNDREGITTPGTATVALPRR
jgi:acyl dehydratase